MKKPKSPPPLNDLVERLAGLDGTDILRRSLTVSAHAAASRYLPWDELRHRPPPEGLTSEEWWLAVKLARAGMQRQVPLLDKAGRCFSYALPDDALRGIEVVNKHASGRISAPEPVMPEAPARDRYLISSLIEEAITSSQLEGAMTTHKVAKDMLRTGRP